VTEYDNCKRYSGIKCVYNVVFKKQVLKKLKIDVNML